MNVLALFPPKGYLGLDHIGGHTQNLERASMCFTGGGDDSVGTDLELLPLRGHLCIIMVYLRFEAAPHNSVYNVECRAITPHLVLSSCTVRYALVITGASAKTICHRFLRASSPKCATLKRCE